MKPESSPFIRSLLLVLLISFRVRAGIIRLKKKRIAPKNQGKIDFSHRLVSHAIGMPIQSNEAMRQSG